MSRHGGSELGHSFTSEEGKHYDRASPKTRAVNPAQTVAPLALFAFATTTLVLSIVNAGLITDIPNFVVSMAFAYGGLCQLFACVVDVLYGNSVGGVITGTYGAFWVSFAILLWPGSGIIPAYPNFDKALGLYLLGWMVVTGMILFALQKTSVAFVSMMVCLFVTFALLAFGNLEMNTDLVHGGGYLGIVTALLAYYNGLADLLTPEVSYFQLPTFPLPR